MVGLESSMDLAETAKKIKKPEVSSAESERQKAFLAQLRARKPVKVKAAAKKPTERYQSAVEFATAFRDSASIQHVRAEVQSDRIALHVNDWYGGTHSGLWEWTSNYGEGKAVNPGDTIQPTVRLRLAELKGGR